MLLFVNKLMKEPMFTFMLIGVVYMVMGEGPCLMFAPGPVALSGPAYRD